MYCLFWRFLWIFLLIHLEGGFIWTWKPPRFFIGKLDVRLFKSKRLISQLNTLLVILLSNLYLFRHFLDLKSTVAFASMYTYINRLFNFSKPSDVQGGGEEECHPPWNFLNFFLADKTSAPDVFSSCSFTPRAHFETSLVMVDCYGYELWRHK